MDPFQTTPNQQPSSPTARKKLWFIVGGIIGLVVIAIIVTMLIARPTNQNNNTTKQQTKPASELFAFTTASTPITYAGSPVYDACNFVSYSTLQKTIPNFTKLLDTVGTDDRASQPVMMQHVYIDRTIASPLGNDANPREPGTIVNNKPGSVSVDPYISSADSNCTYGQTADQTFLRSSLIKNTFAQLYVTQKPTPLSPQFLSFIQAQKKFEGHNFKDIDIYAMPEKDSNGYFTSVFVKKDHSAAVIFKTGIQALLDAAGDDIAATLSKAPTGPLNITYPNPYNQLKSPCALLSADDFSRFTGKPTGALADEAIFLTEVGSNSIRRECDRLEIDRDILKSNIARSKVTVMQSRTSDDAKQFITDEKENSIYEITPLKAKIALGDEVFIKKKASVNALENPYSLVMRKGAIIFEVAIGLDGLDASADAFESRMIPVAQTVLKHFESNH